MRQILWGIKKPLHFYTNFSETLTKFYINTRRMTAGNTTSLRPMAGRMFYMEGNIHVLRFNFAKLSYRQDKGI